MKNKVKENIFLKGNKIDGKHYWLTPKSVYNVIEEMYGIKQSELFDPCPYPQPENFDGLSIEWGKYNYVNPPFGVLDQNGKKIGATAWFKKSQEEMAKGKVIFFVFPIHNWVINAMILCDGHVIHLGNVKWLAIEDGTQGKGCGSICMFVFGNIKRYGY